MQAKQYRPRLSEEEYQVFLAMRQGWKPDMSDVPELASVNEKRSPARILVFDIETAPLRSYTWGLWKVNVAPVQIISDWFMLTWSAKWIFEENVLSDGLTSEEALAEDDSRIAKSLWKLIDEADIVIAHNANRFDVKKMNTRFLLNGLSAPMPYQVIDTLDHLKKRFSISSNRLDYVNELLGIGKKMDTSFELWDGCMRGDEESLKGMEEYNKVDVEILEETYLRIRPWIKPHPNLGLFIEDDVDVCPACGSEALEFGGTPYRTTVNEYESFRCTGCKSIGRSRVAIKKANKVSTVSIPR